MIALQHRRRAQRGKIGAGAGFREALTPPIIHIRRPREEALLLGERAELRDHRANHGAVERHRERHGGLLQLILPEIMLHRRPILSAPFHRPIRHGKPTRVEDALRLDMLLLGRVQAFAQLAADAVGDGGVEEIAQFLPELAFFSGEAQIHCGLLFL